MSSNVSLKRQRETYLAQEERIRRARIVVDDRRDNLLNTARSVLDTALRDWIAKKKAAKNVVPPLMPNDALIDDEALAALELPAPRPRCVPAPCNNHYSFDRNAARIAALGTKHAKALAAVEEHCGYVEELPAFEKYNIVQLITSKRLHYQSRFVLLTFLTMNRVAPILVVELFLAAGMLADQSALDHCIAMCRRMQSGAFRSYTAYSMDDKSFISVLPPCDDRELFGPCEGQDWKPAILLLRAQGMVNRTYNTTGRRV
jgi:hypothetical protein